MKEPENHFVKMVFSFHKGEMNKKEEKAFKNMLLRKKRLKSIATALIVMGEEWYYREVKEERSTSEILESAQEGLEIIGEKEDTKAQKGFEDRLKKYRKTENVEKK